ncbi:DegV family protein [Pediococcus ethanolidurans]|uniref:DegV family protein n=1 Tax=Pediococcus ethanolidurans TaxID=319653 RepID=UPI001C1EA1E5|nr:DegV family protein [Pediococcus ethanolidurans]MBU7555861.1 DegV family protein [Pediococcus ethanolidurans]MCV3316413.1 DegV family protein [Pediococcus ethanolidurans]
MYQLLTDSAVDLPYQLLADNDVKFISMHVTIVGKESIDDLEHNFNLPKFYQQIANGVMPSTTQINIGQFIEFFKPFVKANVPILYLGFSSGLSGTFNNAQQAKRMLVHAYPEAKIVLVDSLAACCGQGLMLLDAIDKKKAGMKIDQLADWLTENRLYYHQWFTVNDLNYLYHGGRVSRTSATVGSLLQIKPVMDVDTFGHLRPVKKVRTRRRSLEALASNTVRDLKNTVNPRILIATSDDNKAARTVQTQILRHVPNAQISLEHIGPTIASHTGLGCVAVFSFGKTKRK